MKGELGRRVVNRRILVLSGLAGLVAIGVPTTLYLTRRRVGLLSVLGTPAPFRYNDPQAGLDVRATAFNPSGQTLAVFHAGSNVGLWSMADPSRPKPIAVGGEAPGGYRGAFIANRNLLATVSFVGSDTTVRLWDLSTPAHSTAETTLSGPALQASSLALRPDGRILAVGAGNPGSDAPATISLWDLADPAAPALLSQTAASDYGEVSRLAFSPDGRTVVAGDDVGGRGSGLWNVADPRDVTPLSAFTGNDDLHGAGSGVFSPDGSVVVTSGAASGTVRLWDIKDRTLPRQLAAFSDHTAADPDLAFVAGLAISPSGRTLATAGPDGIGRLWDSSNPTRPASLATLTGHRAALTDVAFSPGGKVLSTASIDHTVRLWNAASL